MLEDARKVKERYSDFVRRYAAISKEEGD